MEVCREKIPHGQKRRADDELTNDQRLVKRFNLLDLERNGKLYIPVDQNAPAPPHCSNASDDTMQLDDTRDKVYIHNLDDELKGIDEDDEKLIFLPDIERKLTEIPKSVLTSTSQPLINQEMVLYSVPSSLTVPQERDNVRKAIIETRERARQKQVEGAKAAKLENGIESISTNGERIMHGVTNTKYLEDDEDAMEIG